MRLCFGTLATVLICCKGKKKNNNEILKALMKAIDKDNMYLEKDDADFKYINDRVYRLRTSQLDFEPDFIEIAEEANKDEVVQRIECNVLRLFDVDKKEQIVLALLDIIKKDTTIDSHKANNFKEYFGKNKVALCNDREFVLSQFLASTLLYTVTAVGNIFNKKTDKFDRKCFKWIEKNIDKFTNDEGTIKVWYTVEQHKQHYKETGVLSEQNNEVASQNKVPPPEQLLELSESPISSTDSNRDEVISQTEDTLINEVENGVTSQNETPSELMLKIFKQAIEKYNIAEFMNAEELASSYRVLDFVAEIKSDVLCRLIGSQKEEMYENIRKFTLELEKYNHILTMVRNSYCEVFYLINEKEDVLNDFEKCVIPSRQLIDSLYGEICNGETLFVF